MAREMSTSTRFCLVVSVLACLSARSSAFVSVTTTKTTPTTSHRQPQTKQRRIQQQTLAQQAPILLPLQQSQTLVVEDTADASTTTAIPRRPCFYQAPLQEEKNKKGTLKWKWRPRLELSELTVGQKLQAVVVQELLHGQTGPKVFCEVGVGRYRPRYAVPLDTDTEEEETTHTSTMADTPEEEETKEEATEATMVPKKKYKDWKIVYAMLRLGPRGAKKSVAAKRASRLRNKVQGFPVYVSKIRLNNHQLEVSLDEPTTSPSSSSPRVSVASLKEGQELTGRVVRVEAYGVLMDVGANRLGLLHIEKVAQWRGRRIFQQAGLQEAGLGRGAEIQVQVLSNEKKRLFLDFAPVTELPNEPETDVATDTSSQAEATETMNAAPTIAATDKGNVVASASSSSSSSFALSPEEEAAWAAYAAQPDPVVSDTSNNTNEEDEEEESFEEEYEGYSDYDEDRDIEDALGLGSY